jgi:hypothetical protein
MADFTKLSGDELLAKLGGDSSTQHHLAWQAIVDRQLTELAPKLKTTVADLSATPARRIGALWALMGLKQIDAGLLKPLFDDANRNVRREAVRASGEAGLSPSEMFYQSPIPHDPDPEVRAEFIRAAGRFLANSSGDKDNQETANAVRVLINLMDLASLDAPMGRSTQNGKPIKVREAYEREFERYLVRMFLEQRPKLTAEFIAFDSQGRARENTLLATLALDQKTSARRLAGMLPWFTNSSASGKPLRVGQEEVLRLAQFPDEPGVADALEALLQTPTTRLATLEALLNLRARLDIAKLTPLLERTASLLWTGDDAARELALRLASAFKLTSLEPQLVALLNDTGATIERQLLALRALREMNSPQAELFAKLARDSQALRDDALGALAASKNERAPSFVIKLWPELNASQRRSTMSGLASTRNGASAVVRAVKNSALSRSDVDAATLEKLHAVLGEDEELAALLSSMASLFRPVLRLDGTDSAWVDSDITLDGPFTVETWVKLDPGIDNNDGILGAPGVLDMNFFGEQFRVWAGTALHDVIVVKKKISPEVWTHIAVTRDADGKFRIYQNGELDSDPGKPAPQPFEHLRVGWTAPGRGTAGWLTEFRVWQRSRTAGEIRADFDRSFEGDAKPAGLADYFTGANWKKLQPGAKVVKT